MATRPNPRSSSRKASPRKGSGRQSSSRQSRQTGPKYFFVFRGFQRGWYVLTADMSAKTENLDSLALSSAITTWLIEQRITPGTWSHFGSGNTGDYPVVPTDKGDLTLLLKRPADVLRFASLFPCAEITDEAFITAVKREASVHRFVLGDAAKIAFESTARLVATFGEDALPAWEDLTSEDRVVYLTRAREQLENPERSAEQVHELWHAEQTRRGWTYGAVFNRSEQFDPLLVPWRKLDELDQSRYRLFRNTVLSLAELLKD